MLQSPVCECGAACDTRRIGIPVGPGAVKPGLPFSITGPGQSPQLFIQFWSRESRLEQGKIGKMTGNRPEIPGGTKSHGARIVFLKFPVPVSPFGQMSHAGSVI